MTVQYAVADALLPDRSLLRSWVRLALVGGGQITIRFVDLCEGQALNREYRNRDKATNVLSFAYEHELGRVTVGDLVLCVPVIVREAVEQKKVLFAHYAHLVIHGILHLQGYEHEDSPADALKMEALEVRLLAQLGYTDPYAEGITG